MTQYKIIRRFIDKKVGSTQGQYGKSCSSLEMVEKQLAKTLKDYPGHVFQIEVLAAEDTPTEDQTQQLLPSSTGQTNF